MDHPTHIPHIVFDDESREYYNKSTDIFLTDDDIKYLGLKSYDQLQDFLDHITRREYEANTLQRTFPPHFFKAE